MIKILTATIFFTVTVLTCLSQDLTGKWYMVNRSGLIEMTISKDSITNRKLSTDFTPKGDRVRSNQIIETVQLKDRILLISRSERDTTGFSAMTVINFSNEHYFQMAWNGLDTIVRSIDSLIKIHSNDQREFYGYNVFSEHYIDTLNSLKPIEDMTLNDFRKYARDYVNRFKMTSKEFEKFNVGYAAVTHNFQLITQSLYAIGYHPLQNTRTIESLYNKYFDDPEVQTILKEVRN